MDKKRILLCNEASFLSTGFSTYGLEVLKRLHKTGKYEIAEFAAFGGTEFNSESRYHDLPWKYYPNLPSNEQEASKYNPDSIDQFGAWKFEHVCLQFKPHIVWDIRDWWMLEYQERSPFRQFYHWVIMPTVDAAPQDDQWLATYMNADAVFSYSDWGLAQLKEQSQGRIKTIATASPGIDLDTYSVPANRQAHKEMMNINKDLFIIGTVMRNQQRKLYPDLIQAFSLFLKQAPQELAKKTFLYIHCAFPDIGWDIPRLIKEAGVTHKTIFTYFCQNCSLVFPSFYQDARGICKQCGQAMAVLPRATMGIKREILGSILSIFDVYVQYATCEGFGLPQVEAAACGVPVFAVDYSAMSDVVRKLRGYPVNVQRFFRERESHCYRALPDNQDLVNKLIKHLTLPETMRLKKGFEARKAAEKYYNWDRTARVWEEYFDSVQVKPEKTTWQSQPTFHSPADTEPTGLSNEEFIRWGLSEIAGRPDLINSYMAMRMIRDLNWGAAQEGMGGSYFNEASCLGTKVSVKPFNRKDAAQEMFMISEYKNYWEKLRSETL